MIGHVEPYGSVWRTGANAPTKIKFGSPVEILGNSIDSGEYVLYTIPETDTWTVILSASQIAQTHIISFCMLTFFIYSKI